MKFICFDIGNVLCKVDLSNFTRPAAQLLNTTEDFMMRFLDRVQPLQDVGVTTVEHSLYQMLGNDYHIAQLLQMWQSTVIIDGDMINFIWKLKNQKNFEIALLSNMGKEHLAYLKYLMPDLFNNCINHISCEVGARKPTKLFFQSFLHDHPEFENCVYVDDLEENLKTGEKYKFKGYRFNLDEHLKMDGGGRKNNLEKLQEVVGA